MNRKNMTAAVLAGLAGIAGIAGTAQAVNLNPDGLGQVLIYPYYTTNGGNQTILSVVNTTDYAKAVKVRFLEGFNSREVLDFNLYLSAWDVWTAALAMAEGTEDGEGGVTPPTPTMYTSDTSCTVPYIFGDFGGVQPFLNIAYNDNLIFNNDGGPTGINRAAEGHIELIEMGTLVGDSAVDATHVTHNILDDDGDIIGSFWAPADCDQLVANWYRTADYSPLGMWTCPLTNLDCGASEIDMNRNSGGLMGGASVVNSENGTMYSYSAQAIQGYDKSDGERHEEPGTIHPSLNDGDQHTANLFFGSPQNAPVALFYPRSVGAISAVFMHENIMNEYTIDENLAASTEWIVTFPTKSWYVDIDTIYEDDSVPGIWHPDGDDPECNSWVPGEPFPPMNGAGPSTEPGWEGCTYIFTEVPFHFEPFTTLFNGSACETAGLVTWDRDERTFFEERDGIRPPVVSPSLPQPCDPAIQFCESVIFQLCYEVNVLRFGEGVVFGTPNLGTEDSPQSLLLSITDEFENGWGRIDFGVDPHHQDFAGLVGLPATGFAAYEFENDFAEGGDIKAFYGGLFSQKGNVRRRAPHAHPSPSGE